MKHNLNEITRARFIRFQPTQFSTRKALRVEVFGVLKPTGMSLIVTTISNAIRRTKIPISYNCIVPVTCGG